jgi:hypothetical protein
VEIAALLQKATTGDEKNKKSKTPSATKHNDV